MAREVKPLTHRGRTLSELQLRTLEVLRLVRFQLGRQAHDDGMSDDEFIENVIDPFEMEIYQDRHVAKLAKKQAAIAKATGGEG